MSMEHYDDQLRKFAAKLQENSVQRVARLYDLYRKHEIGEDEFAQHNGQINRCRQEFSQTLDKLVAADATESKVYMDQLLDIIYGYGETIGRIDKLVSDKLTTRLITNAKLH